MLRGFQQPADWARCPRGSLVGEPDSNNQFFPQRRRNELSIRRGEEQLMPRLPYLWLLSGGFRGEVHEVAKHGSLVSR